MAAVAVFATALPTVDNVRPAAGGLPAFAWTRVAGPTRQATSAATVKAEQWPAHGPAAVLASGSTDAVAAAGLAGAVGGPVVVHNPTGDDPDADGVLSALAPAVLYLAGGPLALDPVLDLPSSTTTRRLAGPDRYATAAAIATAAGTAGLIGGAPTALVVSGDSVADALIASPIAFAEHVPILPVLPSAVPDAIGNAIRALGVRQMIIVGGAAAVSPDVEHALNQAGVATLTRLAGDDRTTTASAVADWEVSQLGFDHGAVVLARGDLPYDALAAGPLAGGGAAGTPVPLLLTKSAADIGTGAPAFFRAHALTLWHGTIIGGSEAVPGAMLDELAAIPQGPGDLSPGAGGGGGGGAPSTTVTSADLIAADFAAGTIDFGTSLLYDLYAFFDDSRLPPKYASEVPGVDDGIVDVAGAAIGTLASGEASAIAPFLLRPTDPGSELAGREQDAEAVADAGAGPRDAGNAPAASCSAGWATETAAGLRLWICKTGNYQGQMDAYGQLISGVPDAENAFMGSGPTPDTGGVGGSQREGPDTLTDVYISDFGANDIRTLADPVEGGADAYVTPRSYTPDGSSAFMVVRRTTLAKPSLAKAVFTHEYFHVLQDHFSTDVTVGQATDDAGQPVTDDQGRPVYLENWWTEASAAWAEHRFDPAAETDTPSEPFNYIRAFVKSPTATLDENFPASARSDHAYGALLWPLLMEQKLGDKGAAVALVWQRLHGKSSVDDVIPALNGVFPFADHFVEFAKQNLNLPRDPTGAGATEPPGPWYQDLDANVPYKSAQPPWQPPFNSTTVLDPGKKGEVPLFLPHLSARYDEFDVLAGQVTLTFPDDTNNLTFDALEEFQDQSWKEEKVSGTKQYCTSVVGQNVVKLIIISSNHGTTPAADNPGTNTSAGTYKYSADASCEGGVTGTIQFTFNEDVTGPPGLAYTAHQTESGSVNVRLKLDPGLGQWVDNGSTYTVNRRWTSTNEGDTGGCGPAETVVITDADHGTMTGGADDGDIGYSHDDRPFVDTSGGDPPETQMTLSFADKDTGTETIRGRDGDSCKAQTLPVDSEGFSGDGNPISLDTKKVTFDAKSAVSDFGDSTTTTQDVTGYTVTTHQTSTGVLREIGSPPAKP